MSDEAVRKEFHPDAVEIIKFLRDVVSVNIADSDWKQAERFIDAAVQAARSAAIQECADTAFKFLNRVESWTDDDFRDALLALKER